MDIILERLGKFLLEIFTIVSMAGIFYWRIYVHAKSLETSRGDWDAPQWKVDSLSLYFFSPLVYTLMFITPLVLFFEKIDLWSCLGIIISSVIAGSISS